MVKEFDFHKGYVFSYELYEEANGLDRKYKQLTGKLVNVINHGQGYILYKGLNYYVLPEHCVEIERVDAE